MNSIVGVAVGTGIGFALGYLYVKSGIELPFAKKQYATEYPGIVVSPAPASEIHEPKIKGVEEIGFLWDEEALKEAAGVYQVSPAPSSEVHEPTFIGVEEI